MHSIQKIIILYVIPLFILLHPLSVAARENLFDISVSPQAHENTPKISADTAQSKGKKTITMNSSLLSSKAGDELDFVTVAGTTYTAVFDRFSKGRKSKTWVGHLKDYGTQYRVMLTLNKNEVHGRISTPEGILHLESSGGEVLLMDYQLQGMQKVPFGDDYVIPEDDAPVSEPDQSLLYEPDSSNQAAAPSYYNGNTIVDVLVLYNADFATRNSNDPVTRIDFLTALANQAYLDSQVSMQIRVVATELIAYSTDPSNCYALVAISGSSSTSCPAATSGQLATDIATLREQTGADLVIFIRPYKKSTHGGCGLANLNKYMSSSRVYGTVGNGRDIDWVSGAYYYCNDDTYAHELGHTMGLAHDLAHASTTGHYSYSYGYGTDGTFGTIMSYTSPDVFMFSNPNLTTECLGYTCGSAGANNALSLNNDKDTLSGFKDEVFNATATLNSVYFLLM